MRAARENQYDEWSFDGDGPVPYAALLEEFEKKAIAAEEERQAQTRHEIRSALRAEAERRLAERERAAKTVAHTRVRMDRHVHRRDVSLRELDLLTGVHQPLPEDGIDPPPPQLKRWIGPGDGTLAPPVPRLLKLPLVLLLALVEVPIHFMTFRLFHPRDPAMTWCLTIPVAGCMVLGPHLTGVWLRRRLAAPSVGVMPIIASALLMVAWLGSAVVLASLRSTTLVSPTFAEGVRIESAVHDLSPTTLFAVFGLVLVLSGIISFLLGLADDHPAVAAFRSANRLAERAEDAHLRAITTHAGASIDLTVDESEAIDTAEERHARRVDAIRAEHAAAWAAYRDGWSLAVGNPSSTQAVGDKSSARSSA
jgi:hypothetical protein